MTAAWMGLGGLKIAAICFTTVWAANAGQREVSDLVGDLPGFPPASARPFKAYSGMLHVNASESPVAGYDGWNIHYQLEMSQSNPDRDPLVVWHSGGPGTSSLYGLYGEVGYHQLSSEGPSVNEHAWNNFANVLYLEAPAGSSLPGGLGFSWCQTGGVRQSQCKWDDRTQAQAFVLTLLQFISEFSQFEARPLYLIGESYAGQYIPNIAQLIINGGGGTLADQLQGIAIGNGCWGGDADHVACNGPNQARDLVRMVYGKGLMSDSLHTLIQESCKFANLDPTALPGPTPSGECGAALYRMDDETGPYNIFNLFDNCRDVHPQLSTTAEPRAAEWQQRAGYEWTCGQFDSIPRYLARADVQQATHLPTPAHN